MAPPYPHAANEKVAYHPRSHFLHIIPDLQEVHTVYACHIALLTLGHLSALCLYSQSTGATGSTVSFYQKQGAKY